MFWFGQTPSRVSLAKTNKQTNKLPGQIFSPLKLEGRKTQNKAPTSEKNRIYIQISQILPNPYVCFRKPIQTKV